MTTGQPGTPARWPSSSTARPSPQGPQGERITDASFLMLLNANPEPVTFRIPDGLGGRTWRVHLDTATDHDRGRGRRCQRDLGGRRMGPDAAAAGTRTVSSRPRPLRIGRAHARRPGRRHWPRRPAGWSAPFAQPGSRCTWSFPTTGTSYSRTSRVHELVVPDWVGGARVRRGRHAAGRTGRSGRRAGHGSAPPVRGRTGSGLARQRPPLPVVLGGGRGAGDGAPARCRPSQRLAHRCGRRVPAAAGSRWCSPSTPSVTRESPASTGWNGWVPKRSDSLRGGRPIRWREHSSWWTG